LSDFEDQIESLELFHGPSCAFKDFGASFLAAAMEYFLGQESRNAVILVATSGDTGSAVAQAFKGRAGIDVVILYPKGKVSPLQERQLISVGGNVRALEVRGTFDDCQRMVKEAFLDQALCEALHLTSANSINIGRLLPQALYYIYAASRRSEPVRFCVPCGNLGNLTAGVMAWQWGLRASGFIAAANANDVFPQYIRTEVFAPRPSVHTYSNAMDVGNPSNFERLLALFGGDHDRMAELIEGVSVSDEETLEEIGLVRSEHDRFVCPHTAVGTLAARRSHGAARRARAGARVDAVSGAAEGTTLTAAPREVETADNRIGEARIVTLATAHPAKFGDVIRSATGTEAEPPPQLQGVMDLPTHSTDVDATVSALGGILMGWFG
jgi:threonine synthase